MLRIRTAVGAIALLVVACSGSVQAGGECVSGTISAQLSSDPGFEGLYKYTVQLTWSLDAHSLSHVDVFPGFEGCKCACEEGLIRFPDPAGSSSGPGDDGNPCTLDYVGDYVCAGDPSIPPGPANGPVIKFDPAPGAPCEPGLSGTGTFCFYSLLPPAPPSIAPTGLAVKHGQQVCFGSLAGMLPDCDTGCALLPVEASTWADVKVLFR